MPDEWNSQGSESKDKFMGDHRDIGLAVPADAMLKEIVNVSKIIPVEGVQKVRLRPDTHGRKRRVAEPCVRIAAEEDYSIPILPAGEVHASGMELLF